MNGTRSPLCYIAREARARLLTVIPDIDPGNELFLDYCLHRRLDLTGKFPFVNNFAALLADQKV